MRVLVIGSKGKMGSLTKSILESDTTVEAVYGFDTLEDMRDHVYSDFNKVPKIDVAIDFSTPRLLESMLAFSIERNLPLVIATTGYSDTEKALIVAHSKTHPVFMSANYAFGVAILSEVLRQISATLEKDFDIELIEKHHHHKIDAPSGTSLHLAQTINDSLRKPKTIVNGHQGKRDNDQLAIHALRGGSIVGEHQVIFAGPDETIELTHIAQSKSIFAYGAIKAARFILKQNKAKLYDMKDLFKERI